MVLRSPVQLDLIESDLGSAVVSVTPQTLLAPTADGNQDYRFVATYRCQNQEKRLNVLIRTTEGEYGDLLITVVSHGDPKAAKVRLNIPIGLADHVSCVGHQVSHETSFPTITCEFLH